MNPQKSGYKKSFVISLQKTRFNAVIQPETDFKSRFRHMTDLGFDGVELAIRNPDEINKTELLQYLSDYHLEVPAIGTGQAFVDEGLSLTHTDLKKRAIAINRLISHIDFAHELGSSVIIGLIRGSIDTTFGKKELSSILQESLGVCLDHAHRADVNLIIEPLNRYECCFLNTISETISFIESMGSPNLKILADTFHMNIEESAIPQSIQECGSLLSHLHIADSNRHYPGAGHIQFAEIFEALHDISYQGYISGEMLLLPTENDAMHSFLQFIKTINAQET